MYLLVQDWPGTRSQQLQSVLVFLHQLQIQTNNNKDSDHEFIPTEGR